MRIENDNFKRYAFEANSQLSTTILRTPQTESLDVHQLLSQRYGSLNSQLRISLGISPCPNDTFIYQNLIEGKVKAPCSFSVQFADVQTLNEKVLEGSLDMAKISYAVYPLVKDSYIMLESGGAMGYGCGPLLLSSASKDFNPNLPVYLPGKNTTAAMLFRFFLSELSTLNSQLSTKFIRFNELYRKLCDGTIEQGVAIHEHRFTWERDGLHLIADLGAVWEQKMKAPVPLGCAVVRRSLGEEFAKDMDLCVQKSLKLAWERKEVVNDFIRRYAQIDDDEIILRHIRMFVNEFSMKRHSNGDD